MSHTPSDSTTHDAAPSVEVFGFGYRFAERAEQTLRDVSFTLARGSFTVVAGRTGSGKSTLLRALAGLIPKYASGESSGTVRIAGRDLRAVSANESARLVGLVLQSPDDQICTSGVEAEIAFGLENLALPVDEIACRMVDVLSRFGLEHVRHAAPQQLSGGLRQRLVLAAVAAMRPHVLVCDEPLSQLDPPAARDFLQELERLRADGVTVVVAEHRLTEILPCADRVLVLEGGRVTADVQAADRTRMAAALRPLWCEAAPTARSHSAGAEANVAAVVRLDEVSFRYPRGAGDVWTGLTAAIRPGECVALVGPNGSGKSTLLSVLSELLRPTAGRLHVTSVDGRSSATLVPQQVDLTLFSRTVRDELTFGPRQQGLDRATVHERAMESATLFQLGDLLDEPPHALSRGQRVRSALAAAYTCRPALLLLDEPTTGQDAPTVVALMSSLRATVGAPDGPAALLFSTHHLATARRFADRIWLLRDGRLHDISPDDLDDDECFTVAADREVPR